MRITYQTGQGRGVYEVAEIPGLRPYRELVGYRLKLAFGGDTIDPEVILTAQGGKSRLERIHKNAADERDYLHIPRQLSVLLLLPHPTRSTANLPSGDVMLSPGAFLVKHITGTCEIDEPQRTLTFAPSELTLVNADNEIRMAVEDRWHRVKAVAARSASLPEVVSRLLDRLVQIIEIHGRVSRAEEGLLAACSVFIQSGVPGAKKLLGDQDDLLARIEGLLRSDGVVALDSEVLRTRVRKALAKETRIRRGAESERFRRSVVSAYKSTCAVCGMKLPGLGQGAASGVEACHILPYSAYDLDKLQNGICLCRLHHWAFDVSLLSVRYGNGMYRAEFQTDKISLFDNTTQAKLRSTLPIKGRIQPEFLPVEPSNWPNPYYLELKSSLGY